MTLLDNETMCAIVPKTEGYRCMSESVCPLPMWQGARAHTVKATDDDWALLSFKLNQNKAISKKIKDFSWNKVKIQHYIGSKYN